MAGSFQALIFPRKILATTGPVSLSSFFTGQFEDHYNSDQHSRQFENWFLRGAELCFGDGRVSAAEIVGSGMLEPVATSTVFSWPSAMAERKKLNTRKATKNLCNLDSTQASLRFKRSSSNPGIWNLSATGYATRVREWSMPEKGQEWPCVESGIKHLTKLQHR